MGIFDSELGDVNHPIIRGANNHNIANEESSWVAPGNLLKLGKASAVSGFYSLVNTGIAIGRWTGATDQENIDIKDKMYSLDNDLGDYYRQNQTAADVGGFILGSIAPGMLGTKIANAGQKMLGATRLGVLGDNMAASIGLLPSIEKKLITKAVEETAATGRSYLTSPKAWASLGVAMTDDYLQGAAYMLASEAAMSQSPLFDNVSASDMISDAFSLSTAGLGFSAAFRGAGIFSRAKKVQSETDLMLNPARHVSILPEGASPSMRVAKWMEDVKTRPDVDNELYRTTAKKTNDRLYLEMQRELNAITDGDPVLSRRLLEDLKGMDTQEVHQAMYKLDKVKRFGDTLDRKGMLEFWRKEKFTEETGGFDALAAAKEVGEGEAISRKVGKPINAAGDTIIVRRADGTTADSFLPQLSDLLRSKEQMIVSADKVIAGGQAFMVSHRGLDVSDLKSPRMEIEARNISYLERGKEIPVADVIPFEDITKLEHAANYMQQPVTVVREGENKIVTKAEDMKALAIEAKMEARERLVAAGVSLPEIAQRLNVSENFALDVTRATEKDLFRMQGSRYEVPETRELVKPYLEPQHYLTRYDSLTKDLKADIADVAKMKSYLDKVTEDFELKAAELIGRVNPTVGAAELPTPKMLDALAANRFGAGGQLLSFANGSYRSLNSLTEFIGKWVNDTVLANKTKTLQALQPFASRMAINREALIEFNQLDNAALSTGAKFKLVKTPEDKYFLVPHGTPAFGESLPDQIEIKNASTVEFIQQHIEANNKRLETLGYASELKGGSLGDLRDTFYAPPVNPDKYPHFAFVRDPSIGSGGVSTLFARSAGELQALIAETEKAFPNYQVIRKADSELYHKAMADYEFDKTIHDHAVDSSLSRKGIRSQFVPPSDSSSRLDEYLDWHGKAEATTVREAANTYYGHVFDRIEQLGWESVAAEKSTWSRRVSDLIKAKVDNPWMDYRRTALNLSKNAGPVSGVQDWISRKFDDAWNAAKAKFDEVRLTKSPEELDKLNDFLEKTGIGKPYESAILEAHANMNISKNVLAKFAARANSILVGLQLSADPIHASLNALSLPILLSSEASGLIKAIKENPEFANVRESLMTKVPETGDSFFSTRKVIAMAYRDLFGESAEALSQRYKDLGFDITELQQQRSIINDLSLAGHEKESQLWTKLDSAFDTARKLTGGKLAEHVNRFVSARVADILTEPMVASGKMSQADANAIINTFVNRTNGNSVAAQRPQLFQGPIGAMATMYQGYTWNMAQQLLRQIGEGDRKSAALAVGLQASLFGLNGVPGFEKINNLIATSNGNPEHKDLYSTLGGAISPDVADWLLYGLASNALGVIHPDLKTNLYSRGDVNPRNPTIISPNPMDWPAISSIGKMIGGLKSTMTSVAEGAPIWDATLQGLEHMGVNRTLTGLSQLVQGKSTDMAGRTISEIDMSNLGSYVRLAGLRPMHEAQALDGIYRYKAWQAEDKLKRMELSKSIRLKLDSGEDITEEDVQEFARKYLASGGAQDGFQRWYLNLVKEMEGSKVNRLATKMNNPEARYIQGVLGGIGLPEGLDKGINMEEE